MGTKVIEFYLLVDNEGYAAIGFCADSAKENYTDNIGELSETEGFRLFKCGLAVPLPVPIEVTGKVKVDETPPALLVGEEV